MSLSPDLVISAFSLFLGEKVAKDDAMDIAHRLGSKAELIAYLILTRECFQSSPALISELRQVADDQATQFTRKPDGRHRPPPDTLALKGELKSILDEAAGGRDLFQRAGEEVRRLAIKGEPGYPFAMTVRTR
ncbi:hypothetical protein LGH83_10075 [Lichenihabitans sp. PAMC28606]|uniref:hypothetical protein n=1 Tax=Lichenihabitans sp. PAMC28606 TaxID=2880932 RepID=UPI001D0A129A|nr:hypothetical protein [Lichenihabitans sp. PAMC28606]UDL92987.1 hypothetical protein LGH83_10075 [Lichenihabitans sp. PAMC28606]